MGDFFYYGQKDTIQRLNELAGRGAVVASYAPKVGMSPLGGPNGYMDPAWIDPSLPIQTSARLCSGPTAKYGYSYLAQNSPNTRWLLIATIGAENEGAHANLLIRGVFNGNWLAASSTPFTIFMGVRGAFFVDWHIEGFILSQSRIMVVRRANGNHDVYAFFDANVYATISFDLTGMNTKTYSVPVETTAAPVGTIVFDSATQPGNPIHIAPRWRNFPYPTVGTLFNKIVGVGDGTIATSFLAAGALQNELPPGGGKEILRLGVGGIDSLAHPGCFGFLASSGSGSLNKQGYAMAIRAYDAGSSAWSGDLLNVRGNGIVSMPLLKAGSSNPSQLIHNISCPASPTVNPEIIYIGKEGQSQPCVGIRASNGAGGWAQAQSVLYVGLHAPTNRSGNFAGTVNTGGNDYAEYIFKNPLCGIVARGQIVGITVDNKVTDMWADAVMFSIKSTAPSFVGGDSWASDVGPRPSPQAGAAPIQPLRRADVVTQQPVPGTNSPEYEDVVTEPGDTDEEWAEKQAAYTAALAAHNAAEQQDADSMAAFDAALETERQKVDRIAIAGRVPVNVLGAQPGDYIVPVQDGAGIKGIPVRKVDLTHSQYLDAVGRVISIEPDGRAYVMVKAV
ncbi:hypothetical protein [Janthinobacterium sp. UMAB-56]|uniref:hypothetical protein n=1 Tax=Janthinobacterium sp. UMAB-56 TaxID=1365361 RepID=UPI001C59DA26|nr:hypothetical protein [Janthinobacterium sp. UMAB-56]